MPWNDFGKKIAIQRTETIQNYIQLDFLFGVGLSASLRHIAVFSTRTETTCDLYRNSAEHTLVLGIDRINLAKSAILNKTSRLEPSVTMNDDFAHKVCTCFLLFFFS